MEIIHMSPAALRGYDRNARTHSDEQVAQIAASIREFGFNNPILADETSTIIAGHGRLAAALRLGLDTVPVIVLAHLTPAQRRAYILADNKLAANAGWNKDLLRAELLELLPDMDLALLGFSTADLQDLLIDDAGPGLVDPDTLPQSADGVYSVEGDVWVLGGHRIMCGSSTSAEQVRALLGEDRPNLMVTDPPYGVEYDAAWRGKAFKGRYASGVAAGKVLNDNIADWGDAWEHFPGDVAYVWHAGIMADIVAASLKKKGFSLRSQIIWAKSQLVIGRGNYHPMHEPCWYAVRSGRPGGFVGNRKQKTVWRDVADILRPGERVFVCPAENGGGGYGVVRGRDNRLGHPQTEKIRNRPLHAKAGGVHGSPHSQQFQEGRFCVRAVFRQWDDHNCRPHAGAEMFGHGAFSSVCGPGCPPLAKLHREQGGTRRNRPRVPCRNGEVSRWT